LVIGAPPFAYRDSVQSLCRAMRVDQGHGLASAVTARRLTDIGPNVLVEHPGRTAWTVLRDQFAA
jgi:hypothetical protein